MTLSGRSAQTLRRLHSLSGILPVGVFLIGHLLTNAWVLLGPEAYNRVAVSLSRIPYVTVIEILAIGVPILFHMVLGVLIATDPEAKIWRQEYPHPWLRRAQRATGVFLAFFIIYHVWDTRLSPEVRGGETDLSGLMGDRLGDPAVLAFYVLGVLAASYHFGNGLFGFAVHWGLVGRRISARTAGRVGFAMFVFLALIGVNALLAFRYPSLRWFETSPRSAAEAVSP